MNRIAVGEEPIVILVGEAADGSTDLFAVSPGGGPVHQVTFNRPVESHPALNPAGTVVAFFRQPVRGDSTTREVVVLNLVNAAERRLALPEGAGAPLRLAWDRSGERLVVGTDRGIWEMAAPPARPEPSQLDGSAAASADTLLSVSLGEPAFALAEPCEGGAICAMSPAGERQVLAARGTMPFRWGTDSLAWFDQDRIEVRPLGAGRSRQVMWSRPPANPRQATYAAGPATVRPAPTGLVVP
jgi:hypothetical protein